MRPLFLLLTIALLAAAAAGQESPKSPCPSFTVTGPSGIVNLGDFATFSVKIENPELYTFSWKVHGASTVDGQGTTSITASLERTEGGNVTAIVEVYGMPVGCSNTATVTFSICGIPVSVLVDEIPLSHTKLGQASLDGFIEELKKNSSDQGYIILYFKPKTPSKAMVSIEKTIYDYLNEKLRTDETRITFVRAPNSPTALVRLYRVPPGAENPVPE